MIKSQKNFTIKLIDDLKNKFKNYSSILKSTKKYGSKIKISNDQQEIQQQQHQQFRSYEQSGKYEIELFFKIVFFLVYKKFIY
jgi:hypothetical protein